MPPVGQASARLVESPLQFDVARAAETVQGMSCTACMQTMRDVYYEIGGSVVCEHCRERMESRRRTSDPAALVLRAAGYGAVGALIGAAIHGAFRAITGFDVGLLALFVGFIVGRAVQLGTGGRGGTRYQLLAVGLTYLAVGASYLPLARQGGNERMVLAMLGAPVAMALASIVSAVILVLALIQAWHMNRGVGLVVTGPYRIAAPAAPGTREI